MEDESDAVMELSEPNLCPFFGAAGMKITKVSSFGR